MHLKDTDAIANCVNLDQTASSNRIGVYAIYPDLFVRKFRIVTVICLILWKMVKKIDCVFFAYHVSFSLLDSVNNQFLFPGELGPVKRICVFEHSVMTNCNCACPAIQRDQGSGFLSEGSSWHTACMSEQRRFWRDCADAQARLNLRCSHRR